MNKLIIIFISIFLVKLGISQDYSDSDLMKSQSYMLHSNKTNCDSMDGNNLEHKICLNLEFQEVDSVLNVKLLQYTNKIENDSIKQLIIAYQDAWVLNRRTQSKLETRGYASNTKSIGYISNMVFITRKRIEELEHLIKQQ